MRLPSGDHAGERSSTTFAVSPRRPFPVGTYEADLIVVGAGQGTIGDERDPRAVRTPGGFAIVMTTARDPPRTAPVGRHDHEVPTGPPSPGLLDHDPASVRRPRRVLDGVAAAGQRLAPEPVCACDDEPEPRIDECDERPVRRPHRLAAADLPERLHSCTDRLEPVEAERRDRVAVTIAGEDDPAIARRVMHGRRRRRRRRQQSHGEQARHCQPAHAPERRSSALAIGEEIQPCGIRASRAEASASRTGSSSTRSSTSWKNPRTITRSASARVRPRVIR